MACHATKIRAVIASSSVRHASEIADFMHVSLSFSTIERAAYEWPRSINFESELSRLPTGKLARRLLKDRYWGNENSRTGSSD